MSNRTTSIDRVFKALADGNRLRIMNLLLRGELCVCDIEEILGLSQTNVSRHLNKLTTAGLLDSRKEAQWVYYRVNEDFLGEHVALAKYLESSFDKDDACILDRKKLAKARKSELSGAMMRCAKG